MLNFVRDRIHVYTFYESSSIWPSFHIYGEYDVTLCWLMSKHQNIVYKTNLKFEISMRKNTRKCLYIALVNFNLMLFNLWFSILFQYQFTDSSLHCLHPVLVNYEISLNWMMSEAFQCYRRKIGEWRKQVMARYVYPAER